MSVLLFSIVTLVMMVAASLFAETIDDKLAAEVFVLWFGVGIILFKLESIHSELKRRR